MKKIYPMLLKSGDKKDLTDKSCIYEPKIDGIRALCHVTDNIIFSNRHAINITYRYPDLTHFRANIHAKSAILDGEIISYDEQGLPNFHYIQARDAVENSFLIDVRRNLYPATYIIFDILEKDGKSLITMPLLERKKILEQTVEDIPGQLEKIFFTYDGKKLWSLMKKQHMEGVVSKQVSSFYYPGQRSPVWLKIKFFKTMDCIIIGFTRQLRILSSLALAVYHRGALRYIGKVGTGFNEATIADLHAKLAPLQREGPPCPAPAWKNMVWTEPKLVAEIKYLEKTRDGILRNSVFLRLRTDKRPEECFFNQ